MSYTKRADIVVPSPEIAVELAGGLLVAVACLRKPVETGVCYHATARLIDETGARVLDANGLPVVTEHKHTTSIERITEIGDAVIAREMLLLVMGEPLAIDAGTGIAIVPVSDSIVASKSIQRRVLDSHVSGPVDGDALL